MIFSEERDVNDLSYSISPPNFSLIGALTIEIYYRTDIYTERQTHTHTETDSLHNIGLGRVKRGLFPISSSSRGLCRRGTN